MIDGKVRIRARPRARSKAIKIKIIRSGLLKTLLPYAIDPLSYTVALLGIKNLLGLLKIAKLCKKLF